MNHQQKIQEIVGQIKARLNSRQPVVLTKKSVSHVVPDPCDPKTKWPKINIGALTEILEIDTQTQTATAESGVTFYDLARAALHRGLMPYTVPELKTITVGGAVSGCSIESLSYRHGGFHDSCLEYEVIDGDGNVVSLSPAQNPDLFQMIHGSYGTLGILTKLKFKLLPAQPFVRMNYKKFTNFEDFWNFLDERRERADNDFLDAIVYRPDLFIACLGNLTGTAPYTSNYEKENIFYHSAAQRDEDYLTTLDYFFRYDTECHWLSRTVPPLEWLPVRRLFGRWTLGSTNMIKWSKRLGNILKLKKRPDIVVDLFIPAKKFPEFYNWFQKEIIFYPLWILFYRMPKLYPWVNPTLVAQNEEPLYVDCAIYGKKNSGPRDLAAMMEEKVFELGGIKTLISQNYYTEKRFWQIYNRPAYEAAKEKLDPRQTFGTVYKNLVTNQK